jgi:hypothetical protein
MIVMFDFIKVTSCDRCPFFQFDTEIHSALCVADEEDPCGIEYNKERMIREVVVPCPICERDMDGYKVCPDCGYPVWPYGYPSWHA